MHKRIASIDILKAATIVAVILIHTTSASYSFLAPQQLNYFLTLDNFLRFSVPLFVALSGYLLAAKYLNQKLALKEFFLKRALRLLPSYLIWTAIIYIFLHYFTKEPQQQFSIFQIIFLGRADYHLYFVPMLFQLYLLFPLILYLYQKHKLVTLLTSLVLQSAVFLFSLAVQDQIIKVNFLWGDQQQYLLCLTWIFYFTLGIFLFDFKSRSRLKTIFLVLTGLGLAVTVYQSFSIYNKTHELISATTFTRFPVILYATGFVGSVLTFSDKLERLNTIAKNLLVTIGKSSYTIYLMHTIVLRLVYEQMVTVDKKLNIFLFPILVILISITTGILITKATKLIITQLALLKPKFLR